MASSPNLVVPSTIYQDFYLVEHIDAACLTALVWDVVCTLELELALIWMARWTPAKVLYLATRYIPIMCFAAYLYLDQAKVEWRDDILHRDIVYLDVASNPRGFIQTILFNLNTILVEALLVLRVQAPWHGDTTVKIILWFSFLAMVVVTFTFFGLHQHLEAAGMYVDPESIIISALSLAGFYAVTLGLALLRAYQTRQHYRWGSLMSMMYSHGAIYYVLILLLSLAQAISDFWFIAYTVPRATHAEYLSVAEYKSTLEASQNFVIWPASLHRITQFTFSIMAARMTLLLREVGGGVVVLDGCLVNSNSSTAPLPLLVFNYSGNTDESYESVVVSESHQADSQLSTV